MLDAAKKVDPTALIGHEFIGPDGYRLEPNDPHSEIHGELSQYLEEMAEQYGRDVNAKQSPAGVRLLAHDRPNQVSLVLALVDRLGNENRRQEDYQYHYRYSRLSALIRPLLTRRLPYTEAQLLRLISDVIGKKYVYVSVPSLLGNVERHLVSHPLSPEMRGELQALKRTISSSYDKKPVKKLEELLGESSEVLPDPGDTWADRALSDLAGMPTKARAAWLGAMAHAGTADGGKPSAKWLAEAVRHRQAVGEEEITRRIAALLNLAVPPPPFAMTPPTRPKWPSPTDEEGKEQSEQQKKERKAEIETFNLAYRDYHAAAAEESSARSRNVAILKGLAWYAADGDTADLARGLGHLVEAAFSNVRDRGAWASRAGNAGIWALGQMPNGLGVGTLARLRTRLRDRGALKLIASSIEAAARASGMTVDELEDLAVPTGGLGADGTRHEKFGEEGSVRLTLDAATGRTRLEWFGADGKPRKSIPAGVKRTFGAEVKALKAAEAEIASALSAQAARFDRFLLDERAWTLAVWRERYLGHPVLGNLVRRLVWTVGGIPALPTGESFHDVSGRALDGLTDDTPVSLWHPINAAPETVMGWRDVLEGRGLVQPFKQAHREVYLLTDAERNTRTYSNRFAAHVLKQHQFNSLCVLRGWKNALRLMVDDSYPPATRLLPRYGLRAEFWVEGIGDDYGTDTNEAGTYLRLATDQVRFYREDAATNYAHAGGGGYEVRWGNAEPAEPLPLDQVPALAFSEVMRDVDLFVGVASVGNDPAWADGGREGRHRAYWQDYAFGDLGETAKTRADVLGRLLPRLKIAGRCHVDGRFLVVRGDLRTYKIHLGSGNVLMEPNDQYLCIVPGRGDEDRGDLFLPFEGDKTLAIILSKAFLLADDTAITDQTIMRQIKR